MRILALAALAATVLGSTVSPAAGPASGPVKSTGTAVAPNPALAGMPELTLKIVSQGYKGDGNVLDFSGMVYDHHRHKVLAFGGGHATARFPNSVHEFDLATLRWTALTEDVPPSAYTAENAVKTKDGAKLGGVRWKGKIWAGSRHTYDGLVMHPTDCRMLSLQAQEFIGAAYSMPEGGKFYRHHYQGGSGLWSFDPVKREWSVSERPGLASAYSIAELDGSQRDVVCFGSAQDSSFFALNLKTQEVRRLRPRPDYNRSADMSLTWCPDTKSFFTFPCSDSGKGARIFEYLPAADAWKERTFKGDAPNTYSINVVYDPRAKVLACFAGGAFCYFSPADDTWYKAPGKVEMKRLFHHHVYDPVDNVHIAVGGGGGTGGWETYAYKFLDRSGSLPGTAKAGD